MNEQRSPNNKKPAAFAKTKRGLIIEDDLTLEPILRMALKSLCPHVKVDWLYSADELLLKISENDSLESDLIVIMSNLTEDEYLLAAGRRILTPWYLTKPVNTLDNKSLIRELLQLRSKDESV